jgi:hypothetical protein
MGLTIFPLYEAVRKVFCERLGNFAGSRQLPEAGQDLPSTVMERTEGMLEYEVKSDHTFRTATWR